MPYKDPAVRKAYGKKYNKKWRKSHREHRRLVQLAYRKTTKGKAKDKRYFGSPKGRAMLAASLAHNKAKRLGTTGSWTARQFLSLCKKYGNVCLCCYKKKPLGPDHVIPFCKGGTNRFSNIQPLCILCNLKKYTKTTDYRGSYVTQTQR